ncbi:pseudaminic acid synthase [Kribbella solani]|uniref:N-acetylneuraminate synthase n=1 Tax=Kribbella solani TaxID=236067 RepID=A0A841DQI1_9ACTN|nr:pseudaminic acid synthase [Kribbella solani]MBB5981394.1 N-acetylneuraminate synthase [Kribbella solani]MDX2973993.1 pseudaminic acid synthase [Kribbella solani]MDX3005684.1 pseudaminic acid synthase [Kribbella solani]
MKTIDIGGVSVGAEHQPFVIAEMSGNHNGDLERAKDIVRAVAESGAQAIKLQTYTADTMTLDLDLPAFRLPAEHELWSDARLYDLYKEAHTPWAWHEPIFELAASLGMVAFSSAFDPTAIDFLEKLNVPAYKVASNEIGDLPLVRGMAETGKPIIISTGSATLTDIDAAVRAARSTGNEQIIVLSCTASYPAPPEQSNLRGIPVLRDALGVQVGLSDHTMGIGAAVAAVALGATVIEKHVTLKRIDGGVDSAFSLEPWELESLVESTRVAQLALGEPVIGPKQAEQNVLRFRRSLFVTTDVRAGDPITPDNVRSIRPAGGLAPDLYPQVAGRPFRTDAKAGTPLTWDLL